MNEPTDGSTDSPAGAPPEPPAKTPAAPPKPPTMAEIAKAAGVSQGAISSLLNDRDYGIRVSDRTRERVFKVCREFGYVPNDLRAFVRMYPEHGDTCLLLASQSMRGLAEPYIARIAAAVLTSTQGAFAIARYDVARTYADAELPAPLRNGTASKIMCLGAANPSLCKAVQRRGQPFIFIGHAAHTPGTTSILPDYGAAAQLALGNFVKNGHKVIGIVGGPFGSPEPRLAELNLAIGAASQEFGLRIDAANIFQGDLTFDAGIAALDALLARAPLPTAVFCLSEASACGVLARAYSKGLSVPGKLSIIALADHAAAPAAYLPITTIAVPVDELAATAVSETDRQLCAGIPNDPQKIMLGVKLCERESVASKK